MSARLSHAAGTTRGRLPSFRVLISPGDGGAVGRRPRQGDKQRPVKGHTVTVVGAFFR